MKWKDRAAEAAIGGTAAILVIVAYSYLRDDHCTVPLLTGVSGIWAGADGGDRLQFFGQIVGVALTVIATILLTRYLENREDRDAVMKVRIFAREMDEALTKIQKAAPSEIPDRLKYFDDLPGEHGNIFNHAIFKGKEFRGAITRFQRAWSQPWSDVHFYIEHSGVNQVMPDYLADNIQLLCAAIKDLRSVFG